MTQAEAVAWLNSKVGSYWDFDGQYGNQCVDSFNFYYKYLTGRSPYTDGYGVPGAKDLWNVATSVFDKIPDSSTLSPQPGDVIIYDQRWGGGYGHVEMVVATQGDGCWVVGSNFGSNPSMPVQKAFRPWSVINSGIKGVMRYKGFGQGETMNQGDVTNMYNVLLGRAPDAGGLQTYTGMSWHDVFYAISASVEYKNKIANEKALVTGLQTEVTNLKKSIADTQATIVGLQKSLADVQTALTNEKSKPPVEVIKEVEKIVEKPVEVTVEVIKEVPITDATGWAWLVSKIKRIFVK